MYSIGLRVCLRVDIYLGGGEIVRERAVLVT